MAERAVCAIRIATALASALLVVAYGASLLGCDDIAKTISEPLVWILLNPPDPTLAVLLAGLVMIVLFFEPMHEFFMDLEEAQGWRRRAPPARGRDRDENPHGDD
jgi:hypothetical protein